MGSGIAWEGVSSEPSVLAEPWKNCDEDDEPERPPKPDPELEPEPPGPGATPPLRHVASVALQEMSKQKAHASAFFSREETSFE